MSDIFQEVQDEVRQDKYLALWKAYGKYLIAAGVALVLGTAGWKGWQSYTTGQREAESVEFFAALSLAEDGQNALAMEAFSALGERTGSGYGVLARFRNAELLVAQDQITAAVEVYDAMAADSGIDTGIRDLAALYAAMQLMETASVDELNLRLAPLMADNNTWRFSARELYGVVAYRAGDLDLARQTFSGLTIDPGVPPALRARASEMLSVVGIFGEEN